MDAEPVQRGAPPKSEAGRAVGVAAGRAVGGSFGETPSPPPSIVPLSVRIFYQEGFYERPQDGRRGLLHQPRPGPGLQGAVQGLRGDRLPRLPGRDGQPGGLRRSTPGHEARGPREADHEERPDGRVLHAPGAGRGRARGAPAPAPPPPARPTAPPAAQPPPPAPAPPP